MDISSAIKLAKHLGDELESPVGDHILDVHDALMEVIRPLTEFHEAFRVLETLPFGEGDPTIKREDHKIVAVATIAEACIVQSQVTNRAARVEKVTEALLTLVEELDARDAACESA